MLIVDDEPDIVESIRFSLNQAYEVITAINGWEALGAVRNKEPDLVILDVMLPKENGYKVSRLIKDDVKMGVYEKDIQVLLLTARVLNEPDREEMFMNVSQADFMMYKPFEMEELMGKIEELVFRT